MRSPASFFPDSISIPRFFPAVERNPRTLCAFQSVAFMISANVAPLGRAISSRILAPLLSARGVLGCLSAADFATFFDSLGDFFVAALAVLASVLALGAPFCELAPFLEALLVDAIRAPCSATTAAVSVGLVASRVATQHGIGLEYAQRKYAAEPVGKFWVSLARM